MKRESLWLQTIIEAARQAPPEPPPEAMPRPLQTRILAHWREARAPSGVLQSLATLYRAALACASLLMLLSILWSYGELTRQPDNDLAVADYELRVSLLP